MGEAMNVFEYAFTSLQGAPLHLRRYQGQPLLLVNTASQSEFTQQYAKLEHLWADYRQSGLTILALPSDDFGHEEPDNEAAIDEFLQEQFHIHFLVTCKQSVMGRNAHPLFRALRDEFGDDVTPRWNFHKYLFNRQGNLAGYWAPRVEPDDPAITHKIECNLHSWIL
jgi:glutathione peroxidase